MSAFESNPECSTTQWSSGYGNYTTEIPKTATMSTQLSLTQLQNIDNRESLVVQVFAAQPDNFPTYGGRYWGDPDPFRKRPYSTAGELQVIGYEGYGGLFAQKIQCPSHRSHPSQKLPETNSQTTELEYSNGDYHADKGVRGLVGASSMSGMNYQTHQWPQPDETSTCSL